VLSGHVAAPLSGQRLISTLDSRLRDVVLIREDQLAGYEEVMWTRHGRCEA